MSKNCKECDGTGYGDIVTDCNGRPDVSGCDACFGSGEEISAEELDRMFDSIMDGRRYDRRT